MKTYLQFYNSPLQVFTLQTDCAVSKGRVEAEERVDGLNITIEHLYTTCGRLQLYLQLGK